MAKSSTGRKGSKGGTRHKNHRQKSIRSLQSRKARRITINNCVRKRGRLARSRMMSSSQLAG